VPHRGTNIEGFNFTEYAHVLLCYATEAWHHGGHYLRLISNLH
jgi:hypothetical protein